MDSFLFLSVPLAVIVWVSWVSGLRTNRLSPPQYLTRSLLGILLPLLCGVFLYFALTHLSARDVRSDPAWIGFYLALGMCWIGASVLLFAILGISMRDDVIERRNVAAAYVVGGQLIGITFCFTGANVGEGPGPEVVLFCAALSTISLMLMWVLYDRVARIADRITIERDAPTGIRSGALFAALGIVLGAGVAGDWVSVSGTLRDFVAYAWAPIVIGVGIFVAERFVTGRVDNSTVRPKLYALFVGGVYVLLAAAYVYKRGLR